jgi:hypothetical protein
VRARHKPWPIDKMSSVGRRAASHTGSTRPPPDVPRYVGEDKPAA